MKTGLKFTPKMRGNLRQLFEQRAKFFSSSSDFYDDDELFKTWTRYLTNLGCRFTRHNNYTTICDPIFSRSIHVPKELAQKLLVLNCIPPLPQLDTVRDLICKYIVREYRLNNDNPSKEYRLNNHNISVYDLVTHDRLFLFHTQTELNDYTHKTKKLEEEASAAIYLGCKVIEIKNNEAIIETRHCGGDTEYYECDKDNQNFRQTMTLIFKSKLN